MSAETVDSLAALVGGRVVGDGTRTIRAVGDLRSEGPELIGFLRDPKYRDAARATRLAALLTVEPIETDAAQIVVADVGVAFAKIALHLHPAPRATRTEIHPTAVVHPEARIDGPVAIGPHATVGRCRIGPGSVLMAGTVVSDGCELGATCVLWPHVTLYPGVRLGERVTVHANSVLGSDGFGYAREGDVWLKMPQVGGVVVADDVEIGANVAIDRGAIGDTRIGPRTKIDNLCQIAHNCVVGADVAIAAGCMIAGSTQLGDRVTLGGHVVVAGHLKICADARIGGNSGLIEDIEQPGDYMGWPIMEKRRFLRHMRALRELMDLREGVDELQRRQASDGGD